jgi:copper chaperone NosL
VKATAIAAAVIASLVAVVIVVVRGSGELPDQPQPVAWDRETCAHCHMHVGEPRHAAQLVTTDGDVLVFDDVGCALDYLADRDPSIHRLWFHGEGDALVAVEAGTPGATPLAEVQR